MDFDKAYQKLDRALTNAPVIGPHWQTTLSGWAGSGCIVALSFIEKNHLGDKGFLVGLATAFWIGVKSKVAADAAKVLPNLTPETAAVVETLAVKAVEPEVKKVESEAVSKAEKVAVSKVEEVLKK